MVELDRNDLIILRTALSLAREWLANQKLWEEGFAPVAEKVQQALDNL